MDAALKVAGLTQSRAGMTARPIYLLADSELLFRRIDGTSLFGTLQEPGRAPRAVAAYIGASNGDAPEYFEIFRAAMSGLGIQDCRAIRSSFLEEDAANLEAADVIVLAGGDVEAGRTIMEETGLSGAIRARYLSGATLIGVSAGAVQLGLFGFVGISDSEQRLFHTLKLVPFMIDVHDQPEWTGLASVIDMLGGTVKGIGIPKGAGMIYHPDASIEAVRRPLLCLSRETHGLSRSLIVAHKDHIV